MNADEQIELLKKVMDGLEQQLGGSFELVLHDLRRPFDSTIVDIRNGYITGRKIGDCSTNHGLSMMRKAEENGDEYNYITHMPDGRVFRSSSMYMRDGEGKAVISFCINQDITQTLMLERQLHEYNRVDSSPAVQKEFFAHNVNELLDFYIDQAQYHVGKKAAEMNRAEKMQMIEYLDNRGAFLITHSGSRVCDVLGISKFTLYNYLEQIHGSAAPGGERQDEEKQ